LKLTCDILVSKFALKCNLYRYSAGTYVAYHTGSLIISLNSMVGAVQVDLC
jgi:hypothetical protein